MKKDENDKKSVYTVNSRISFKLTQEDSENGVIDFLNVQDNVSKAIKETIKQYIREHGNRNISSSGDIVPSQKVIEGAIIEALLENELEIALSSMYDIVSKKLEMSAEARNLKSEKTYENVYEKRLRFATVSMKQRGILETGEKRGILKLKPFLRQFKKDQIMDLDSIVDAMILHQKIKDSNV